MANFQQTQASNAAGDSPTSPFVRTYPSLYEPILVLGMPAFAFFSVTVGMGLLLILTGFHAAALLTSATTPWLWALLRRVGRDDPDILTIIPHGWFFRRFYQPVAQLGAPAQRIDRRVLLP